MSGLGELSSVVGSLAAKLEARRRAVSLSENYFDGNHPLPSLRATENIQAAEVAYRKLLELSVTNWVKLVADAPAERLEVIGFKTGDGGGVDPFWDVWQANQMDADSHLVHETALVTGQAFVMVWPNAGGSVTITPEHPSQMIVQYSPGSQRRRLFALKSWAEGDRELANLFDAENLWKFERVKDRWEPRHDAEDWPIVHGLGDVPVVEFRANPSLRPAPYGGGRSEMAPVISIQDRINRTIFQRLLTAEFSSFPQRWISGIEIDHDDSGNPINPFKSGVQNTWIAENSDTKFGQFAAADLTNLIAAVESDVQHMAAITKTPPYYLLGQMVNISAEALDASNAGLIMKTRRHAAVFGEAWEQVRGLSMKAAGLESDADLSAETVWRDIENRTLAQTVDGVLKMKALGVPNAELWSRLPNVSPQMVDAWEGQAVASSLLNGGGDEFTGIS